MAAPTTTLDPNLAAGSDITIEHRPGNEVTHFQGKQVAPDGIDVSLTLPLIAYHSLLQGGYVQSNHEFDCNGQPACTECQTSLYVNSVDMA